MRHPSQVGTTPRCHPWPSPDPTCSPPSGGKGRPDPETARRRHLPKEGAGQIRPCTSPRGGRGPTGSGTRMPPSSSGGGGGRIRPHVLPTDAWRKGASWIRPPRAATAIWMRGRANPAQRTACHHMKEGGWPEQTPRVAAPFGGGRRAGLALHAARHHPEEGGGSMSRPPATEKGAADLTLTHRPACHPWREEAQAERERRGHEEWRWLWVREEEEWL